MFKLNGNEISLTRGDTLCLQVRAIRKGTGEEYTPVEGDKLRFALKHSDMVAGRTAFKDLNPLIVKDIPISTMQLKLDPIDTKNLKFGTYTYDIELTFASGEVDTIIPYSKFNILPEVH